MNRIESNIKINGRHWGLDFTAGVAYTGNAALAAKLRLKGYTVTNGQPETAPITGTPAEAILDDPTETPKPKTTKSRKRAVKADAADAS